MLFSCFFSLRNPFFAMCSIAENPVLNGEEQVKKIFPPFSTSPVTERTIDPLFLLRSCALWTRIENVLDYAYGVLPKKFLLSLLCVYFIGNIIMTLPFITIFIKSYSDKCEVETVLAWQSSILLEAVCFCTQEVNTKTKRDQTAQTEIRICVKFSSEILFERWMPHFVWGKICRH